MSIIVRTYQSSDLNAVLGVVKDLQAFELEMYDRMMPVEQIGEWYFLHYWTNVPVKMGKSL